MTIKTMNIIDSIEFIYVLCTLPDYKKKKIDNTIIENISYVAVQIKKSFLIKKQPTPTLLFLKKL